MAGVWTGGTMSDEAAASSEELIGDHSMLVMLSVGTGPEGEGQEKHCCARVGVGHWSWQARWLQ